MIGSRAQPREASNLGDLTGLKPRRFNANLAFSRAFGESCSLELVALAEDKLHLIRYDPPTSNDRAEVEV